MPSSLSSHESDCYTELHNLQNWRSANELQIKAFSEDPDENISSTEMDSVTENAPTAPLALPKVGHLNSLELSISIHLYEASRLVSHQISFQEI